MIIHIVAPFAVVIPFTGLSSLSGGDPNSSIINIMQTAFAKNNNAGQPQYQYFINKLNEGRLVYINTKMALPTLTPLQNLGVNNSPLPAIKLSNTIENIIKKIPDNVKTEKDLAKLKAGNPSYYQEGKQIEKGRI